LATNRFARIETKKLHRKDATPAKGAGAGDAKKTQKKTQKLKLLWTGSI